MNSVNFIKEKENMNDKTLKNKDGDIFVDEHGKVAMMLRGVYDKYWLVTLYDGYVCADGFDEKDTIDKVQEAYGFTYVGECNITIEKA